MKDLITEYSYVLSIMKEWQKDDVYWNIFQGKRKKRAAEVSGLRRTILSTQEMPDCFIFQVGKTTSLIMKISA
jgi:hypothetical protein